MAERHSTVEYREIEGFPGYRVGDDGSVWSRKRSGKLTSDQIDEVFAIIHRGTMTQRMIAERFGVEETTITQIKRRGIRNWKRLSPAMGKKGYHSVCLRKDGATHRRYVHRLVLEAFVGRCPDGMETRHKDGNPANNALVNLEWSTHLANMRDQRKHGTHREGESHQSAKLTKREVLGIRRLHKHGHSFSSIARRLQVSVGAVSDIVRFRNWKNL